MNWLYWLLVLVFCSILLSSKKMLQAQPDTSFKHISSVVQMDTIVFSASRQGFDVEDFIYMTQTDSSFYKAFRNLRVHSHKASHAVQFFDKKQRIKASYKGATQQYCEGDCRTMETLEESTTGKYYKKNKNPKYYTAKMYETLFFTKGRVCQSKVETEAKPPKGMRKNIEQLKILIFQPGKRVKVPLIGAKTAIFEPKMMRYYDYTIQSKRYNEQVDCYVFMVAVKPAFRTKKKDKTVIKHLETYFDKGTFQVIARKYSLAYRNALFDFDVTMEVELDRVGEDYIPTWIHYEGFWKIPTQKAERAVFTIQCTNFQ